MRTPLSHSRGFIALMSVLILSAVLLATTLSLAQFGIANRYFILELENKVASEKLAEACIHIARIAVYNNPLYSVSSPHTLSVGGESCELVSVHENSGESTIHARGTVRDAITNLEVAVDTEDGAFLSWKEVRNF